MNINNLTDEYPSGVINIEFERHDFGTFDDYRFAEVIAVYQGKWVFSKHKDRNTWETQGGHIEPGETPFEAAKRELYEEAGAVAYDIVPLCDYLATGIFKGKELFAYGQVYFAEIHELGALPDGSEMEKIMLCDAAPDNVTYPEHIKEIFPLAVKHYERGKI